MSKVRWETSLVSGVILLAILACASPRPQTALETGGRVREGCLNSNHVRSFTPLHERFVYVRGRSGEHFLLTMDRYCVGLTHASGMTLASSFARICSGSGAVLTYSHIGQRYSCGVLKVEVVPDKATAERLVHERTPPRPQER